MLEIEDNESGNESGNETPVGVPGNSGSISGARDEWGLLPRMRAFADEWLACGNQTMAAILAGYNPKGAEDAAQKLLKNVKVRRYLAYQQAKIRADREDRQRRLLEELEILAHSDLDDFVLDPDEGRVGIRAGEREDGSKISRSATRALSKIKLKTKRYKDNDGNLVVERDAEVAVHSKTAAVDMYMKHLGMYPATGSKLSIEDSEGNTLVIEEVLE